MNDLFAYKKRKKLKKLVPNIFLILLIFLGCEDEKNYYRVEGSGVFQRNFAIFNVYGNYEDRQLSYYP